MAAEQGFRLVSLFLVVFYVATLLIEGRHGIHHPYLSSLPRGSLVSSTWSICKEAQAQVVLSYARALEGRADGEGELIAGPR